MVITTLFNTKCIIWTKYVTLYLCGSVAKNCTCNMIATQSYYDSDETIL